MNFENFNDFCKSELVLREEFRDLTVKSDARERIHRDRFGPARLRDETRSRSYSRRYYRRVHRVSFDT